MKQVLNGEKESRTTTVDVDNALVIKHHVTSHKSGGDYAMDWIFDFSGCTQAQILEIASRDAVIKMRPKFKVCKDSEIETWENKTFDMSLQTTRVRLTPMEKAMRSTLTPGVLTDEEKRHIAKELERQLKE